MEESQSSKASSLRACLECQKRKTKCVFRGVSPKACAYCTKTHKRCVFEAPPSRTPLTRKNLDLAERRSNQLEALLRSLDPNINIEAALDSQDNASTDDRPSARENSETSEARDNTPGEEFEWDEASTSLDAKPANAETDGMATMATTTSGYLGSSSASGILQSISAMLPPIGSPGSQDSHRTPGFIRVKSTTTPDARSNANLAKAAVAGRLIDAYFLFYNSSYPILHERSFRERYEKQTKVRPSSSYTAILHMVLAIGQWVLGEEGPDSPYYASARSWLSAQALETGTLGAVQAFLLMGNYLQKRDRPNTGYNIIGIAYRMALGLGMHREITSNNRQTMALERRRQVFWTLFCFDSGLSITTGRPATIIDAFVDVQLPRNIDDSYSSLTSVTPDEVDYPTTYSAIIAQTRLVIVANEIYTQFLSARMPHVETIQQTALAMEEKLLSWRSSLPAYFVTHGVPQWFLGPRAVILWKEQNLRIMLWRGCSRHHTTPAEKMMAGLRCRAVATETINEIADFCNEHPNVLHIGLNWYATYFLFQAILVLDVHRLESAPQPQLGEMSGLPGTISWNESITRGKDCLRILNTPASAAGRCLETLDKIHGLVASNDYPTAADRAAHLPQMQDTTAFADPEAFMGGSEGFTPEALNMQWTMAADPSLHMLLDDPQMDSLFRDVEGFPGTLDQQSFDYIAGDLYRI